METPQSLHTALQHPAPHSCGGSSSQISLLLAPSTQPPATRSPQQFKHQNPLPLSRTPLPLSEPLRSHWTTGLQAHICHHPRPRERTQRGPEVPCPFLGHLEYLLCPGGLGGDLWHVPRAVAPHLPQCPRPFPFFCPQRLRGAQSCGLIAASPGTVASP